MKIFVKLKVSNLTFSQMFWLFGLFLFTLEVAEITADCTRKEVTFRFWQYDINLKNNGTIVNLIFFYMWASSD